MSEASLSSIPKGVDAKASPTPESVDIKPEGADKLTPETEQKTVPTGDNGQPVPVDEVVEKMVTEAMTVGGPDFLMDLVLSAAAELGGVAS